MSKLINGLAADRSAVLEQAFALVEVVAALLLLLLVLAVLVVDGVELVEVVQVVDVVEVLEMIVLLEVVILDAAATAPPSEEPKSWAPAVPSAPEV